MSTDFKVLSPPKTGIADNVISGMDFVNTCRDVSLWLYGVTNSNSYLVMKGEIVEIVVLK